LYNLLNLFLENLLPVFLVAGAGALISRRLRVEPRTLSQVTFYVLSPCLLFTLIVNSQLSNSDIARVMLFAAAVNLLVGAVAFVIGRLLKLERRMLAAVVLTSVLMNAGNYGLAVNRFAFGEVALAYASLYFVTSSILTYTVGVIIASLGTTGLKESLLNLFKIPTVYGLLLAFIFLRLGWQLPAPLNRAVTLLGNATIPTMLLLLGMQFQRISWQGKRVALAVTSVMRLLVAPALAVGLNAVFHLEGSAWQAGVLESAMPSAVITTVLATEYDLEPAFISTAVFVTTLLSVLTVTPILAYLQG
jgi:predicted permease